MGPWCHDDTFPQWREQAYSPTMLKKAAQQGRSEVPRTSYSQLFNNRNADQ